MYFSCFGNESSLSACQSSMWPCRSSDVAGVQCRGEVVTGIGLLHNNYTLPFDVHAFPIYMRIL